MQPPRMTLPNAPPMLRRIYKKEELALLEQYAAS